MAVPTSAFGAELRLGDGAGPEVFTAIASVKSISGLQLGNDLAETTAHDAASRARTYVTTLRKSSQISFTLQYDSSDATHDATTGITAAAAATTSNNYQLALQDNGAAIFDFAGIVDTFEITAEVDGINEASMTIQVTGPIVET